MSRFASWSARLSGLQPGPQRSTRPRLHPAPPGPRAWSAGQARGPARQSTTRPRRPELGDRHGTHGWRPSPRLRRPPGRWPRQWGPADSRGGNLWARSKRVAILLYIRRLLLSSHSAWLWTGFSRARSGTSPLGCGYPVSPAPFRRGFGLPGPVKERTGARSWDLVSPSSVGGQGIKQGFWGWEEGTPG